MVAPGLYDLVGIIMRNNPNPNPIPPQKKKVSKMNVMTHVLVHDGILSMYNILKCIVFIIKISSNIKVIIHLILQISLTLYFSTTKIFKTDIQIVLSFTFYHCHVHVIVWPNYELHHSLESKLIIKNSKKKLKNLNKLIQIHVIFSMLYNELVIKKNP